MFHKLIGKLIIELNILFKVSLKVWELVCLVNRGCDHTKTEQLGPLHVGFAGLGGVSSTEGSGSGGSEGVEGGMGTMTFIDWVTT